MRCDDGSDIDIAFHEAHLTLRDGTPGFDPPAYDGGCPVQIF